MDRDLAEETSLLALRMSAQLDEHLLKIREQSSKAEFEKMRSGIGLVMGYLYTDIMEPIWNMHPDLRPKEMDGEYTIPEDIYRGH
jgi:hypothetical protein